MECTYVSGDDHQRMVQQIHGKQASAGRLPYLWKREKNPISADEFLSSIYVYCRDSRLLVPDSELEVGKSLFCIEYLWRIPVPYDLGGAIPLYFGLLCDAAAYSGCRFGADIWMDGEMSGENK